MRLLVRKKRFVHITQSGCQHHQFRSIKSIFSLHLWLALHLPFPEGKKNVILYSTCQCSICPQYGFLGLQMSEKRWLQSLVTLILQSALSCHTVWVSDSSTAISSCLLLEEAQDVYQFSSGIFFKLNKFINFLFFLYQFCFPIG